MKTNTISRNEDVIEMRESKISYFSRKYFIYSMAPVTHKTNLVNFGIQ